jgi:chromosome segregation ATPase
MKKFVLLAFMALSMVAVAQTVTPITIQVAEFKKDSLRALYISEPPMYRASLDIVEKALDKNMEDLKTAKAELKVEQTLAKEMKNSLAQATKMAASMKKLYAQEESQLKSMQKVIEGQQKMLNKQKDLNKESREAYMGFLENQQKELGYALREVAERQRAVAEQETAVQNSQTQLQTYNQQITTKATELARIEAKIKEVLTSLKAEQKAAKSLQ